MHQMRLRELLIDQAADESNKYAMLSLVTEGGRSGRAGRRLVWEEWHSSRALVSGVLEELSPHTL